MSISDINTYPKPKIIYILGYGRSGSTLVDTYLSAHKEIQGLGELMHLFNDYETGALPEKIKDIVNQSYQKRLIQLPPISANKVTISAQTWSMNPDINDISIFKNTWYNILINLGFKLQVKVLVDSSKSTRISFWRPYFLKLIGFEVHTVLLKRNYSAVNYSITKRGSNRRLEGKYSKKTADSLLGLRSAFSYIITHQLLYYRLIPKFKNTHIISYEDFTDDPSNTLSGLLEDVGLSADGLPKNGDSFEADNLAVRGNRMRRKASKITIQKDIAYKAESGFWNMLLRLLVKSCSPSLSEFRKKATELNKVATKS